MSCSYSSIETFKHFVISRKPASDGLHNIDACPDVDRRESDGSVGSCESPSALASAHDSKRITKAILEVDSMRLDAVRREELSRDHALGRGDPRVKPHLRRDVLEAERLWWHSRHNVCTTGEASNVGDVLRKGVAEGLIADTRARPCD